MTETSGGIVCICGCSFVRDIWKKMGDRKEYTKEEKEAIIKHCFDVEKPCYWCGYDLEGRE